MAYPETKRLVLETTRRLVRERLEPIAAELDREEAFPLDLFLEMGKLGLMGIPYPEEYGGVGLDHDTFFSVIRAIAEACPATAMSVVAHSTLAAYPIFLFGSDSQKEQYLAPLAGGTRVGAYAITEPEAGSDIAGMRTTATKKGDLYFLNGSKTFITNANCADIFTVAAMTAPGEGPMGISVFLLNKTVPGFIVSGKRESKLGMRASDTGELLFQDTLVPSTNLLGRKNWFS
jgi:butyryl-CoA dehydrogenase/acyl-CoA dehydrogenase